MRTLLVCLVIIASSTAWGVGPIKSCQIAVRRQATVDKHLCFLNGGTTTTTPTTTTTTTSLRHVTIGGVGGNPIDCVLGIPGGPYCQHPADQPPDRILSMTTTPCADGSAQVCVALALTPDYIPWPYWFCTPACSP